LGLAQTPGDEPGVSPFDVGWELVPVLVSKYNVSNVCSFGKSRGEMPKFEERVSRTIEQSPCSIEVIGNVLHDECRALYT
jgi:hypothetical protein